jgi:hypothetical protein
MIPPDINDPQAMIIIAAGQEMGLQPLQALRTMSFIRGRLCMTVQLQLAMARQRAGVRIETLEETADGNAVTVTLVRDGERVTVTYTLDDAERAGLADQRNWRLYPRQMLRWRAIGDALRIIAPDVVMGLLDPEEASSLDPVDAEAWEQILSRDGRLMRELIAQGDEEARLLREQLRVLYSAEEMRQVLANLGANALSDLTLAQARQLAIVGELRNRDRAINPPPERVEQAPAHVEQYRNEEPNEHADYSDYDIEYDEWEDDDA